MKKKYLIISPHFDDAFLSTFSLIFKHFEDVIYYLSRDIKLVMIGHLLYNIPHIYIMLKLYHRDYINPNHYQKLLIKDDFDDLLI